MNVINDISLLCTAAIYLTHSNTDANGRYILVMLKKLQYDERISVCSRQLLQPGGIFCVYSYLYKILAVLRLWSFPPIFLACVLFHIVLHNTEMFYSEYVADPGTGTKGSPSDRDGSCCTDPFK
jgi:hypothetical protein